MKIRLQHALIGLYFISFLNNYDEQNSHAAALKNPSGKQQSRK